MLITKRILESILHDKTDKRLEQAFGTADPAADNIIEVNAPVVTVHKDRFALWTEADDDLYMLGDIHEDTDVSYAGFPIRTKTFETTDEIRAELSGKKIFLYVLGTEAVIRSKVYAGFEPKGFLMRYAVWEKSVE